MSFRIAGLDPTLFEHLYGLSDAELCRAGVFRCVADQSPGFPDRISLEDVSPGEHVLLLNYQHQPMQTPYQASHAIFIKEGPDSVTIRLVQYPPRFGLACCQFADSTIRA